MKTKISSRRSIANKCVLIYFGLVLAACQAEQAAEPVDIDWQAIEGIEQLEAMGVMNNLTRHLDYWNRGQEEDLGLRYVEPGVIEDRDRNRFEATPEEWKGLVLLVHQAIRSGQQRAPEENLDSAVFLTPSAAFFNDGLGEIKRHAYLFQIENPTTLRVELSHHLSERISQ